MATTKVRAAVERRAEAEALLKGVDRKRLLWEACATKEELWEWVKGNLNVAVPTRAVCEGHCAPFEYLWRAYREPGRDLVVWGPRGGGKTRLGAVATLLDLMHKPGCEVKILSGSLEQGMRMWEYLRGDLLTLCREEMVGRPEGRRVRLGNGSGASVLAQSQRAVRGVHVQKMRCDEVELFKPDVWSAAQLTAKGKGGAAGPGSAGISGTVEAMSTFHKPWGVMADVVKRAEESGTPVLKWCLLEVLERCPAARDCNTCSLFDDCRGVAKSVCDGYLSVDDAIAMKRRVSLETWNSEIMCRRIDTTGAVFGGFDPGVHVVERAGHPRGELWLAVDFGFRNPFVALWIDVAGPDELYVFDEYVQAGRTIDEHVREIGGRAWPRAGHVACDPAGNAANDQSARSNVELLKRAGYKVHTRSSHILEGVGKIRDYLLTADGAVRLRVHPRCKRMVRALREYRYAAEGTSEIPLKDGEHDHLTDALRYFFVNYFRPGRVEVRQY